MSESQLETVEAMIRKKRLRWYGHVRSKNGSRTYPGNCWYVRMYVGWKQASVQLEDKSCKRQTLSSRT